MTADVKLARASAGAKISEKAEKQNAILIASRLLGGWVASRGWGDRFAAEGRLCEPILRLRAAYLDPHSFYLSEKLEEKPKALIQSIDEGLRKSAVAADVRWLRRSKDTYLSLDMIRRCRC